MERNPTAASINTLVRFCARRDVDELTADQIGGRADVAILFGGSILVGAAVLADVIRKGLASFTMIVGGQGHSTDALRAQLRDRMGWGDVDRLTEAAMFRRYLHEHDGLTVDAVETASTNCGNNVTNALAVLDELGVRRERILLIQDATMQQRMDAGFRRHVGPTTQLINFASHQTVVDDALHYESTPEGMWQLDRYAAMLMGEVSRLTDDENGYGPMGRGYIAHVDVPAEVTGALNLLQTTSGFAVRAADARWTS